MLSRTTLTVFFLLLGTSVPHTLQADGKAPRSSLGAGASDARKRGAPVVRLALPVTGLDESNAGRAAEALEALEARGFQCPLCKAPGDEGACKKCGVDRQAGSFSMLTGVEVAPASSRITVEVSSHAPLRLSQLLEALPRTGVTVQDADVPIPGPVTLILRGTPAADDAGRIERKLREAKLYGSVKVAPDPRTGLLLAHAKGGKEAPARGALIEALAGDPAVAELVDVEWHSQGAGRRAAHAGNVTKTKGRKAAGKDEGKGKKGAGGKKGGKPKGQDDNP